MNQQGLGAMVQQGQQCVGYTAPFGSSWVYHQHLFPSPELLRAFVAVMRELGVREACGVVLESEVKT